MTQQTAPFIETKYGWDYGESGWNGGMDENLLKYSILFDRNIDGIVSSLPSVVNGTAYFLTTDNRIYFGVNSAWYSSPVPKWFILVNKASGVTYQFNGTVLAQVDSPAEVEGRLDAVELTISTLGTAAYEDIAFFATQTELDIASAQSSTYTDTKVNTLSTNLSNNTSATLGSSLVGFKPLGVPTGRTVQAKLRETVSVTDFGALGDGITDDTVAIQTAINSGVKNLIFPAGTYMIGAAGLTGVSNQSWKGAGKWITTIKMSVAPTLDMVYIQQKLNFKIDGITFDGNGKLTAGVGHYPSLLPCIHLSECTKFEIENCGFIGFYNCGLLANVVKQCSINSNYVDRATAATFINHGIGVSGESEDVTIKSNTCYYSQISLNAINSLIEGNLVSKWGFSAGINIQATSSCYNIIINANICHDSNQALDISPYAPQGIENWAANSVISNNICFGNFGDGIGNGGRNCNITDNNCFNNKAYGIYNTYQDSTFNASGTTVSGNNLYDTRVGGARTQLAGYAEQLGGLTGIMFSKNPCTNNLGTNVFNCTLRNIAAQYDWTDVTSFQNSWVDFGGGTFSTVGYYKDTDGIVHLRGAVKSGTVASPAFTLPTGFRPSALSYFPCVSNNLFGFMSIGAGGGVTPQSGSNSYFSLDGISFRAA